MKDDNLFNILVDCFVISLIDEYSNIADFI